MVELPGGEEEEGEKDGELKWFGLKDSNLDAKCETGRPLNKNKMKC